MIRISIPLCAAALFATPAMSAQSSLSLADSFRVGSDGVVCTAQNRSVDPALKGMFDRAFAIVCQDAASAVGKVYRFDQRQGAGSSFSDQAVCESASPVDIGGIPGVTRAVCTAGSTGLRYVRFATSRGRANYLAEGLAGYESAVKLALQSVLLDRAVAGTVEVAVTEAGDPAAFARVQAGNLDPDQALAEGYARNNVGSFPEAAEFFDTLLDRARGGDSGFTRTSEYAANRALQLSNLGRFVEAEPLFVTAETTLDLSDPVQTRLLRNYRMIHALNQGNGAAALAELAKPQTSRSVQLPDSGRLTDGYLDKPIVQRINADDGRVTALGGGGGRLSVTERALLLDAQARQLEGAALRLTAKGADARAALQGSIDQVGKVRNGRVTSAYWLRASALIELAALAEAEGNGPEARKLLNEAVALYATTAPGSPALTGAQVRLAVALSRAGDKVGARTLFREATGKALGNASASANIRNYLVNYFDLLIAPEAGNDAVAELFTASQLLVRPGLAQTQAVFARELSGGDDEASRLFRRSLNVSRDVVRLDGDIASLAERANESAEAAAALALARDRRGKLGEEQTALLSKLAEYPRFRAVSESRITLPELQSALGDDEAYYRLVLAGDRLYGLFVTKADARAFPLKIDARALADKVAAVRDSITITTEDGRIATPVFDVQTSQQLYLDLFGPVSDVLAQKRHLVFEPDGAMLQLPANLLVTDQASVDAYLARTRKKGADAYDMRGVAWLGKAKFVSTAVSSRGFVDIRSAPPSQAKNGYLGIGENAVPNAERRVQLGGGECSWPAEVWDRPISSDELKFAADKFSGGNPRLVLGNAFTDEALTQGGGTRDYRIIHFATHGLVSAPAPECPARPALVTSFGSAQSDGLLTFREVFDLQLDADLVLLSACDTAGEASVSATREAGLATGGNFALDGLVRAFVAAGARTVVATYWPIPDDYDATKTLINGLLGAEKGLALGDALRVAQIRLMDRAETSHPFYWSAFGVIGDGAKSLSR